MADAHGGDRASNIVVDRILMLAERLLGEPPSAVISSLVIEELSKVNNLLFRDPAFGPTTATVGIVDRVAAVEVVTVGDSPAFAVHYGVAKLLELPKSAGSFFLGKQMSTPASLAQETTVHTLSADSWTDIVLATDGISLADDDFLAPRRAIQAILETRSDATNRAARLVEWSVEKHRIDGAEDDVSALWIANSKKRRV